MWDTWKVRHRYWETYVVTTKWWICVGLHSSMLEIRDRFTLEELLTRSGSDFIPMVV